VLTVLKRERRPQQEQPAEIGAEESDEQMSEVPPDLAMLEDTVFRDKRRPHEESSDEGDDMPDVNGNGDGN
jgi:hypothetical protein